MKEQKEQCRCPHCGFPVEEMDRMVASIARLEGHLRDAELALRQERAKVTSLRSQRSQAEVTDPMHDKALEVFEYWRATIAPKAREMTGTRFRAVSARLKATWEVADLKRAVDGAKDENLPEWWSRGSTIDLEMICRNEKNLLMFLSFAEGEAAPQRRMVDAVLEVRYQEMVAALTPDMITRLGELRGYTPEAVTSLGLGFSRDDKRIVFPARNADGVLVGFSRWLPNPETRGNRAKNIAEGPRELFPPPEFVEGSTVWLVEGEPDAVAMASMGYPAVAVPGVATWKEGWARRFAEFERVRIVFDCDAEGRKAADARQAQLAKFTDVQVVDLDPDRDDHFDVGDVLLREGANARSNLDALASRPAGTVTWLHEPELADSRSPIERLLEALEAADCRPRRGSTEFQYEARCPAHEDRRPSLSIGEGDDGRVLLTCHAGCEAVEVLGALGLTWKEMFVA